ncbi:MAG TPA: threonine synthase [Ferruginibacter sp.]|nr:threonine synthase [Ferruginibacter sp.]
MQFFSTNRNSPLVDFKDATINGQAPDKGLYFPVQIQQAPPDLIKNISLYSNEAIGYEIIKPYIGESIPHERLQSIVEETLNFPIPLVGITDNIYSLELFHGPTLAFKDVGARFMSRCLSYFVTKRKEKIIVLVATSGDTGGAVANGFYEVEGVEVVILFPSGKVSKVQEKQLTTLGKNIHAIEVKGTFDDCQQMVKDVFSIKHIYKNILLTSANSINVSRWLPQQFYYFFAYKQWKFKDQLPVISVPSGNFGNICAGLLAMKSGLPVEHFIAACNSNDMVPQFLETYKYEPKPAIATISNAMDVGDPSNFIRILELFKGDIKALKGVVTAYSIKDDETRNTIKAVYRESKYLLDPHGAVGYRALERYLDQFPFQKGIFIETAHPVKFFDVVEPIIGNSIDIPGQVSRQMGQESQSEMMANNTDALKEYLMKLNNE